MMRRYVVELRRGATERFRDALPVVFHDDAGDSDGTRVIVMERNEVFRLFRYPTVLTDEKVGTLSLLTMIVLDRERWAYIILIGGYCRDLWFDDRRGSQHHPSLDQFFCHIQSRVYRPQADAYT